MKNRPFQKSANKSIVNRESDFLSNSKKPQAYTEKTMA